MILKCLLDSWGDPNELSEGMNTSHTCKKGTSFWHFGLDKNEKDYNIFMFSKKK